MADLLLELGLEEIPARMIAAAEAELGRRVTGLLTRERLLSPESAVTTYSTPRRLAVRVEGLIPAQPDTEEQLVGPSWKIGFPQSPASTEPGPAAIAFAKKAGVEVTALTKVSNAKGEYLGATVQRKGRTASDLLAADLPKEVLALYWAKNMYWRANKPERFVRPLRWLVALLDNNIVPLEIAGIQAGNTTRGHRILHGATPVSIANPAAYAESLKSAFVEPDVAARRHKIRKALDHVTRTIGETPGARWREDEALVETVVHLTEWPTVLYGTFESEYLALPEEVLVTVMRDHQKYFAVENANRMLAPHFLTVLNTQVDAEGESIIRHGNERVLRSRFKDAQFFWETDQKIPLTDRVEMLKPVTFQKELGSYYWKTEENLRIVDHLQRYFERLEAMLATVGVASPVWDSLREATRLAKTDLTCELVKEFTELQGEVGGLYAKAQSFEDRVQSAIYWQYRPASTEDSIPPTLEGQLLGLVDRVQTITSMFQIGSMPTGSKDPFGLRRSANGVVKILAESGIPLPIKILFDFAINKDLTAYYGKESKIKSPEELGSALNGFMVERLSFYLKESRSFAYDVVSAVLAAGADDVRDVIARAEAITAVRGSEDFLAISAASKRIKNILRQASEKGESPAASSLTGTVLTQPEELALQTASTELTTKLRGFSEQRNYAVALEAVASLRPYVDAFFDKIMVMAPEPELRAARLALIQSVFDGFSGIADFSEIVIS